MVSRWPLPLLFLIASSGCSKTSDNDSASKAAVNYGDAIGIEFGDLQSGKYLAAVAAEKGHSPEKGVTAIATALGNASKTCPSLAQEAKDEGNAPTLHFLVKDGTLEAGPATTHDTPSVTCMTKAMNGKATGLDPGTPFELTIQLLVKK